MPLAVAMNRDVAKQYLKDDGIRGAIRSKPSHQAKKWENGIIGVAFTARD